LSLSSSTRVLVDSSSDTYAVFLDRRPIHLSAPSPKLGDLGWFRSTFIPFATHNLNSPVEFVKKGLHNPFSTSTGDFWTNSHLKIEQRGTRCHHSVLKRFVSRKQTPEIEFLLFAKKAGLSPSTTSFGMYDHLFSSERTMSDLITLVDHLLMHSDRSP